MRCLYKIKLHFAQNALGNHFFFQISAEELDVKLILSVG